MNVSVIIPLYNGERWIEETLRSVLAQTHRPQEIVVVDDGSDDESPSIVRSLFPEVKLLHKPGEGGQGAGSVRDFGLQHTSAPLVAFLDQDDLWHPDHLRVLTDLLDDSNYSAAIAGLDHFTDPSAPSYNLQPNDAHTFSPWDRYPMNDVHSPTCVVVRRRALDAIGGWPSQFMISDYNAWLKLATVAPMIRTSKVTAGKRDHKDSALHTLRTKETLSYIPEHIKICEDALAFRAKVKSAEDIFRIRLDTLKAIGGVFEGAIKGNAKLITDSARFIERERRVEQDTEKELWGWASWVLRHQVFSDDLHKQRRVLGRIIDNWPNQCRRARNTLSHELIRKISSKTFVAYAIQNPMRAITSLLFTECMKRKLNAMPLSVRRVRRKAAQSLRMA